MMMGPWIRKGLSRRFLSFPQSRGAERFRCTVDKAFLNPAFDDDDDDDGDGE
jgi:hypothetical protein